MKRPLALLLAILISLLASCGAPAVEPTDSVSVETTTEKVDTTPVEVSDDLPDKKFD